MNLKNKISAVVIAAALMTGVNVAFGTQAQAAACLDANGPNYDTGKGTLKGTYALKNNFYASCDTVATLPAGTVIFFHCWRTNDYGNKWVYGRVKDTSRMGWMSVDNFSSYTTSTDIPGVPSYPPCNLN